MAFLVLVVGGFIVPAIVGWKGYSVWVIAIYAAVFHLIARSSKFRAAADLPTAPDTSNIPIGAFVGGWVITFLPMLIAYGAGWLLDWLL
jgi:hypothetical protein